MPRIITNRPSEPMSNVTRNKVPKLQMETLTIDVHTQKLRVMIERTKRQKLETTIRKLKRDFISPRQLSHQLQNDVNNLHSRMSDMQHRYDHKIAQINTTAYRSLARVHQLLITFTPYVPMTVETHVEVSQLNYELYRTIEQLKPHSEATESSIV